MNEFLIYCNTRQFLTNRWKGEVFSNAFYLSDTELKRWHVSRVQLEAMPQIKTVGLNKYNVQDVSEIDISLIKPHGQPLTDLHRWMLERVCETEMPKGVEVYPYWNSFIRNRSHFPELYFTVDDFAGRVHTPISGMSKELRPFLLLRGEKTVSMDVAQMQPMLLGEVLKQAVGNNAFSAAINEGKDIYIELQEAAQLESRDAAKKRFYQIVFGKVDDNLHNCFKDKKAADWINWYKQQHEARNPRAEKMYNNLAWILQTLEVRIMGELWRELAESALPYVSIHDEIRCRKSDVNKIETIFKTVLSQHFETFKINIK